MRNGKGTDLNISVQVKKMGRKPTIECQCLELADKPTNAKELISLSVSALVANYNKRVEQSELTNIAEVLLGESSLADAAASGKIAFGTVANRTPQNLSKAIDTALLAFQDGLFVCFIDDEAIENLEQKILLQKDSVVTFIKMTNLSGRLW